MWQIAIDTPVGRLRAFANEAGLRAIVWPGCDVERYGISGRVGDGAGNDALACLTDQVAEYFAGTRRQFDLPLDPVGTAFQRLAWNALRAIPYATTRTYGEQAAAIGRPSAARAVGAANGRNPLSIVVPCHRVIGADGGLIGFAGGVGVKRFLLEHERNMVNRPSGLVLGAEHLP